MGVFVSIFRALSGHRDKPAEKRAHPRYPCSLSTTVTFQLSNQTTESFSGEICNISLSGMLFRFDEPTYICKEMILSAIVDLTPLPWHVSIVRISDDRLHCVFKTILWQSTLTSFLTKWGMRVAA